MPQRAIYSEYKCLRKRFYAFRICLRACANAKLPGGTLTAATPDELEMYRDTVRKFADRECPADKVAQWERENRIPRELLVKMAELGILGLTVPEAYGGLGRQVLAMTVVMEELAYRWYALGGLYNMCVAYGALNIVAKGTEEQKRALLPPILEGRSLYALGLSEPDVGADLASVKTRAERRGDRVIINGSKRWISGANIADYVLTLVRSGDPEQRRANLSLLIVPTNSARLTITPTPCMGSNVLSTNDISFENVEIDQGFILGGSEGWNNGWSMLAGPSLEIEKLVPSIMSLAVARAALDEAWNYSQERVQGGKRICGHQSVRHVLADCKAKLWACQLMTYESARLVEENLPSAAQTSMAKLFVAETAKEIVLSCQQYVMGAYGYAQGFQMERLVRDVLAFPIYGGSTAIQRNNIANLLKLPRE